MTYRLTQLELTWIGKEDRPRLEPRSLLQDKDKDKAVIKWFKPGKGVFQIRNSNDADCEPDFVVETATEKLLCEPKGADRMQDAVVLAKARAAAAWCKHATEHEHANQGKPWRYLLIPHDAIADNMSLDGLAKQFTFVAPEGEK